MEEVNKDNENQLKMTGKVYTNEDSSSINLENSLSMEEYNYKMQILKESYPQLVKSYIQTNDLGENITNELGEPIEYEPTFKDFMNDITPHFDKEKLITKYEIVKEKRKLILPLCVSCQFKKIYWEEVNRTYSITITLILRVVTKGLENYFSQEYLDSEECWDVLMSKILNPIFRVNDEILDEAAVSRSEPEYVFPVINGDSEKQAIGFYTIVRSKLNGIFIDRMNSKFSRFPFDVTIIKLSFDFPAVKMLLYGEEGNLRVYHEDTEDEEMQGQEAVFWDIKYNVLQRSSPNPAEFFCKMDKINLISLNENVDNLETHDLYNSIDGYEVVLTGEDNKIAYYVKTVRSPYSTIKSEIFPLIGLMFISTTISSFGPPENKLGNLLAVYLTYGAFALVISESSIDANTITLADRINMAGIAINSLQFFSTV